MAQQAQLGYKVDLVCRTRPPVSQLNGAAIEQVPGKGNGVVAQQDLCTGHVVLVEQPLLKCLYKNREALVTIVLLEFPVGATQAQKAKIQDGVPMLFDKKVASGDLILMTAEANLATQHGVPELDTADAVGLSGSLVWRTAIKNLSPQQLAQKVAATESGRAKRRAVKRARVQ
eukprot:COSAG01_NODE_383_length_17798_cov_351.422058_20_plen_173_part_00